MRRLTGSKIIRLVFSVLFAVSVLAGCSKAVPFSKAVPAEMNADADVPAGTKSETKPGFEPAAIKGYLVGTAPAGFGPVMDELNKRLGKDLNVSMEISYIAWGDLNSKYPLILAAGDDIDWIYTASWCYYAQEASKGAFLEITPELLERNMPLHYERVKDTTAFQETLVNGKSYMITTSAPDKIAAVVLFREDLRKKYNVPEFNRFSDIEPYLEAIKKNEKEILPMNLDSQYDLSTPYLNLLLEQYQWMVEVVKNTGVYYNFEDPEAALYTLQDEVFYGQNKKVVRILKSWYDKGYINRNAFNSNVRSKDAFSEGKSAIGFGNSTDVQGNIALAVANGYEVGIFPMLDGKTGHTNKGTYNGNGVAIAARSRNADRTMMALDLIMEDPEYSHLVYYGIEDVNYVIKDGKISLPDGITAKQNTYPVDAAGFWFINRDAFEPLTEWTPEYIAVRDRIINGDVLRPNFLAAYSPMTDSFSTELANCTQVMLQYMTPILIGAVPDVDASLDTLASKLKEAGQDKIKAELEEQIEKYLESLK